MTDKHWLLNLHSTIHTIKLMKVFLRVFLSPFVVKLGALALWLPLMLLLALCIYTPYISVCVH